MFQFLKEKTSKPSQFSYTVKGEREGVRKERREKEKEGVRDREKEREGEKREREKVIGREREKERCVQPQVYNVTIEEKCPQGISL